MLSQTSTFYAKLLRGVGTSRAKRHLRMLERGEWDLLQKQSLAVPSAYHSADAYMRDVLVVETIRKLRIPGDAEARKQAAIKTFWVSEAQCAETNLRLHRYVHNYGLVPQDIDVMHFISAWRKNVARVVRTLPKQLTPRFSGGATLSDKGSCITIPDKMSSIPTVYRGSEAIFKHSVSNTILERHSTLKNVRANRFFTVPKDSEKDRGCCVEPSGAIILQLDVDRVWKRRYENVYKVDLAGLPTLHRNLACEASARGHLATIDLSNASDTVSRRLVELLMPRDWLELLNSLRAHVTEIDGKQVWLEKFSSMGNGFTFMLETILFKTLCDTLGAPYSSVFGDDIVVTTEYAGAVLDALAFFGFTPNERKTFLTGPFRESCGGDFFDGHPVRGHYLKEIPDEPQKWVALANGLRRVDPNLRYSRAAWRFCIDQLPTAWRHCHNDMFSFGDAGIYDPSAKPTLRPFADRQGVPCFKAKVPIAKTITLTKHFHPDVQLAAAVVGVESEVPLRDQIVGYKTVWRPAVGTNWLPKR